MKTIDRSRIRKIRALVQWIVLAMVTYAGISFYFFARALENGIMPSISRSPSVEGFMPIGALMALKLWIAGGVFDPVHPAALVLFIIALLMALLLKKSFCSWICPVGTLSEAVGQAGKKLFGKNVALPKFLDYPLRSVKYLLMAFFLYVILLKMTPPEIVMFLDTPYWKVADIKLLAFFTEMSLTTQVTLGVLFGASLFYRNVWCRYLCPYGGLLGLLSAASPITIQRNQERCIRCGSCSRNCPSLLPVDRKKAIRSPECTGCLTCVSHCPAEGALNMALPNRRSIKPELFVAAVVVVFFGGILVARLSGKWHSSVTPEELMVIVPYIKALAHP
ncbi:MAG: 4Fe-4S binding protein [Alphaproteobacteria bacterium]|uniref:4Fe-4S binding protein n=1 Tax=Candidatus Nitrobium versatile TaxID=2884831 RepID=A0A953M384_9BACT|nr:4Fe-4S binding protein [Candidatus Nitrobium versatile]